MDRTKDIYRVTLVGSVINVVLLLFKFVAGIIGHSAAMLADAVHSLSDFVTDVIVLVFIRISGKPQDKSHDYGHGKYETLAMTLIGVALLLVALGILNSGAMKIKLWLDGEQLEAPGTIALWAALLSVVLKEGVYRYSMIKAHQLNSPAVEACPFFHRYGHRYWWCHLPRSAMDRIGSHRFCCGGHLHRQGICQLVAQRHWRFVGTIFA